MSQCIDWRGIGDCLITCVRVINSLSKIIFKISANSAPTEYGAVPTSLSVNVGRIDLCYDCIFSDESSFCSIGFANHAVVA